MNTMSQARSNLFRSHVAPPPSAGAMTSMGLVAATKMLFYRMRLKGKLLNCSVPERPTAIHCLIKSQSSGKSEVRLYSILESDIKEKISQCDKEDDLNLKIDNANKLSTVKNVIKFSE
ncbi:hypothetical protein TYRP_015427 [Tyrophagus putrescentiae]|nr:hypothetical protein TYRP_015427 [Tyrophagus putrescentiae]